MVVKLFKSVNQQLISDVPLGVFLSGGIDSSINASMFSKVTRGKINAFSIGYPKNISSYTDETSYAKKVANKVGANQIALGTDYPFPLGETIPGDTIEKLKSISKEDKERLFHGTALEWLDLDKKLFI